MRKANANCNDHEYEELKRFNLFLLGLTKASSQRKISTLFRGDKLSNVFTRLGMEYDAENPNYRDLLDRLFMVGDKARHFYNEQISQAGGRQISLEETNEETFKYIFDHLNKAVKSKNPYHKKFFDKNEEAKRYFQDKKNKTTFLLVSSGGTIAEKKFFKYYYLSLLHQLAEIGYKAKSHIVSTSKKISIAEQFAGNNPSEKRIVLYAWKPIFYSPISFRKKQLPRFNGRPYSYQKEISIVAGILPHFIYGLEIVDEGLFFINPYLFNNPITSSLFKDGFNIDQTNFDAVLTTTNYRIGFNVVDNDISERA